MLSDRVKQALLQLGFSSYEVRVYSTLLAHGSMTAIELSKASNVPYNKIYEVLSSLEKKGFVRVEEGRRPSRYHPVEPRTAFEKLKKEMEEKLSSYIDLALSEVTAIYEKKGIREKSDVWLIRGEQEILKKLKEMISRCRFELFASIPRIPQELSKFFGYLSGLSLKDVKAYVLISKEIDKSSIEGFKRFAQIRITGKMFGGGIIIDSKEVLLLLPEEEEITALWSDHIGLANFAKNYFMYIWESSSPL